MLKIAEAKTALFKSTLIGFTFIFIHQILYSIWHPVPNDSYPRRISLLGYCDNLLEKNEVRAYTDW